MTIKDIAQRMGVTPQAIYKRLKAQNIVLDDLKDSKTGHFTAEGEARIQELFAQASPAAAPDSAEVEVLTTRVEELTTEVERLTTKVAELTTKVESLESERDFLRSTLEREQQLHGITLTKLPQALPPAQTESRLRGWWNRIRGRNE
jgi:predicted  nucleic acid-binding Zn-ribbon protein